MSDLWFVMAFLFSEEYQREASRLIISVGQLLMQHGAESEIVRQSCVRLGRVLQLDAVELSLSASSMVVTTLSGKHCITTARRCPDRGINMRVVSEVLRLISASETTQPSLQNLRVQIANISTTKYNRWIVVGVIGLSCASFCRLADGDWMLCMFTFLSASVGMIVRQEIAHRHFSPLLNFGATAFVTTVIAAQAEIYSLGNSPTLAMASSVLMLVPGFPLINAISDMAKGYANMGVARWLFASLLGFSTSIGIIAAMTCTGVWTWI